MLSQHPNHFDGVTPLPEEMAEVAIGADLFSHGLAETKQRARVVDDESRMHFEGELMDVMFACKLGCFLPVRNDFFFPLPIEDLRVFGRPSISGPVGHGVGGRSAR